MAQPADFLVAYRVPLRDPIRVIKWGVGLRMRV